MKVHENTVAFQNLGSGDVFSWQGSCYITTDHEEKAVNLDTGRLIPFRLTEQVTPLSNATVLPLGIP
jgi:hypothetical protein